MAEARCVGCGSSFYRRTGTHKYCTPVCRERHRGLDPARRRRYSSSHQRVRAQVAVTVEQGRATCARCGEPIRPGVDDWDLDHADGDGNGYLGPSHAACNRATTPRVRGVSLRWSQRWFDDPPVGPIVYGHERVIYLGDGEWQPLGHKANYQSSPPVEALDNHGA
jgi:hypothetical protein